MVLIDALHASHLKALSYLQLQFLLLSEHLAELMAQQGSPGDVVVVISAGIANVACMEDLFNGCPFMLAVSLYIEARSPSHLLEFLQIFAVKGHVSAENKSGHYFLGFGWIFGWSDEVQIWIFLQDFP